jgi:hypothetical protein
MIRKLGFIFIAFVVLTLFSPMMVYWWGLSNLETDPVPSHLRLTSEQEQQIWSKEKEIGIPRIKSVTPYGYILSVACIVKEGLYATECMENFPGLRLSALAVRKQVGDQVVGKGNTVWQFTWMSYTIWVTQHWDIHQILATYHEAYNT